MTTNFDHNAQSASSVKPVLKMSAATLDSSPGLGERELELQRMIYIVSDQYKSLKNLYGTLKDQNTRLQEELNLAQKENKRLLNDKQAVQEKMKMEIGELQFNLLARTKELQELHRERNNLGNLEFLRTQVLMECEASFRQKSIQLVKENEMYSTEYCKLQYECSRLSAQLHQQKEEHNRKLNLQEVRYQGEISCLEKEKEELLARYKVLDTSTDVKQLQVLKRERSQFLLQLRGLKAKVAELHAQKENLSRQVENIQHAQIKQWAESQTMLKTVKTEQELLHLQLERMQKELDVSHEQNSQLTKLLHKAEGEVNSLTSQIEKLKCTQKQEVSRITLEFTKCKGELQKETDKLQRLNDGLQSDAEVLKAVVAQHEQLLVEKQRELDRTVQSVRDEELRKTVALKEEKLELENRLAVLEQQRALKDTADEVQTGEWEARLCSAQNETQSTLRELQNLRTKLQQQSSQLVELETQKALSADLQQQNKELVVQLGKLSHSENELTASNQQLTENLEKVREHLKTTEKSQQEAERVFHDQHLEWMEEKNMLCRKYSAAKEKLQRASAAQNKRKILTEKKEKNFECKIQLLEAKIVELELEVAAAKKQVSSPADRAELRRLREVVRRHDLFGRILVEGSSGGNPGFPASLPVPVTVRPEGSADH